MGTIVSPNKVLLTWEVYRDCKKHIVVMDKKTETASQGLGFGVSREIRIYYIGKS